jgi:purine catabolism regulator
MATHALDRLASEFDAKLRDTDTLAFLCPHEGNLVALCNAEEATALKRLEAVAHDARTQSLERLALGAPARSIAIGLGGAAAGLEGLRHSLRQAYEALSVARELTGRDQVLSYGDLGVYALLCRLRDGEEMADFYEQTLAPLVLYDANHNTRLVQTLEAFFAHLGNVSQTAESLYLHRNSLLYRLERISEITGRDLNDEDDRFSLQLALRMLPLMERRARPN